MTYNSIRMPTALQKAWLCWCKWPHVHRRTPRCAMSIAPTHCHSHLAAPVAQEVVSVPVHLLAAPPAPPAHPRVALSSNNVSTLGCLSSTIHIHGANGNPGIEAIGHFCTIYYKKCMPWLTQELLASERPPPTPRFAPGHPSQEGRLGGTKPAALGMESLT